MNNGEQVIKNVFLSDNLYRRSNTLELRDALLIFNPKEKYLDYGTVRPASRTYVENELKWYLSLDKSILGHKGIEDNKVWKNCATINGNVNSNYGNIVFSKNGGKSQMQHALDKLREDKNTRQSVIIYNRPEMHEWWNDGIHANRDFTCTMYTQHFIEEDNTLTYIVSMRSNDAIFGLQNDYSWHQYLYEYMLNELKCEYGKMIWHAGSLHIYERHFKLLEEIKNEYINKREEQLYVEL